MFVHQRGRIFMYSTQRFLQSFQEHLLTDHPEVVISRHIGPHPHWDFECVEFKSPEYQTPYYVGLSVCERSKPLTLPLRESRIRCFKKQLSFELMEPHSHDKPQSAYQEVLTSYLEQRSKELGDFPLWISGAISQLKLFPVTRGLCHPHPDDREVGLIFSGIHQTASKPMAQHWTLTVRKK